MKKKKELTVGYYPMMQISRPNLAAGLPRGRWVYCNRAHALSVLQEFYERSRGGPAPPTFAGIEYAVRSDARLNPWLLLVQIPPKTKVAEAMRRHTFASANSTQSWRTESMTERFPAYRLMESATVLEVIEVTQDDEWVAIQIQRAMQK